MNIADYIFHNVYLLEEIFSHALQKKRFCNLNDGNQIVRNGLLKLLKEPNPNLWFSYNVINLAAANGHLDIVKWLHKNLNASYGMSTIDVAAKAGHTKVARWLRENYKEPALVIHLGQM